MFKKLSNILSGEYKASTRHWKTKKIEFQDDSFNFLELIANWEEIIGERLAKFTIPLKNKNKTLTILTNHSAFSEQLSFMEGPLKKKIFKRFPQLKVTIKRINFITDTNYFEQKKLQNLSIKKNSTSKQIEKESPTFHKFSPEYKKIMAEAEEIFCNINNSDVKQSLISIYIQSKHTK